MLFYSLLFSTFYMTGSGKPHVAYIKYVKMLPCVSQSGQTVFVVIYWVILKEYL